MTFTNKRNHGTENFLIFYSCDNNTLTCYLCYEQMLCQKTYIFFYKLSYHVSLNIKYRMLY